ncbi:EAL domain-containing protein [Duganella sp. FT92W]|uniref:EAL domain-containing protein n=1 Tax=Pseudoduganella rivuli TaxID=2666085 RepID=A0A7X2LUI9_9BURK|nr:bifunctional diguanylate cyclase/phosphodiesterase [Pseudoduganella rivuli]MRV74461.1 EAL domain-containing protein [Pseudoduganella rivuli]
MEQTATTSEDAVDQEVHPHHHPAQDALDLISHLIGAMELTPLVAVHCMDHARNVQFWNDSCRLLYGIDGDGALGKPLNGLYTFEDQAARDAILEQVWQTGQPSPAADWRVRTADGRDLWVYSMLFPVVRGGVVRQVFCMDVDVTARKQLERQLNLAAQVFEYSRDAIVLMDRQRRIIAANHAYAQVTGRTEQQMLGHDFISVQSGFEDTELCHRMWREVDDDGYWQGEIASRRAGGDPFPGWLALTAIRDAQGNITNYMGILSDISDRKKAEERTRHLAEHDYLTDLPNRVLLQDRLSQALAAARRHQAMLAILYIDLDHFKQVNDTLGHPVGDALLKEVAARLVRCVRGADTVSRYGGDEFLVLLADIGGSGQAAHVAGSILQALAQPCVVEGHTLPLSASIGISIFPGDGGSIDELIARADVAMYHAKQNRRNSFQFFNPHMHAQASERAGLEQRLRAALAAGEFTLHYQPEIDVRTGQPVAMEALLRWCDPQRGVQAPQHFLPVAEAAGLMPAISQWVLREACGAAQRWRAAGQDLVVAVNVSPAQFAQLPHAVAEALAATGLPPDGLELELTEDLLMKCHDAPALLQALHAQGVRLAIDDFGTGYSQLGLLKTYPVGKLKIDRSFTGAHDGAAIAATVAMARSLHMQVTAEGVETAAQLDLLRSHGCDYYQGLLAERQVEGGELVQLLR